MRYHAFETVIYSCSVRWVVYFWIIDVLPLYESVEKLYKKIVLLRTCLEIYFELRHHKHKFRLCNSLQCMSLLFMNLWANKPSIFGFKPIFHKHAPRQQPKLKDPGRSFCTFGWRFYFSKMVKPRDALKFNTKWETCT